MAVSVAEVITRPFCGIFSKSEVIAMRTKRAQLAALGFILWSAPVFGQVVNALTAQERTLGWRLLFDGRTLTGWHSSATPPARGVPTPGQFGTSSPCVAPRSQSAAIPAGASQWEIVDGLLIACGDPAGYLTTDQSYRNFVLSIEFKTSADANSGVFVRSPNGNGGYEVQIWKQQPAGYNTGGIVGTAKTPRDYAFKADQWNLFQITADGDHLTVVLNGETTVDAHDARFAEGQIRLQYQQFPIAFRNIKIRPLP
jgi:hypothetical protein